MTKHTGEVHESKSQLALILCTDFGAIRECKDHEGSYIDSMEYSHSDELTANILKVNPEAIKDFDNQHEMSEYVRMALDFAGDECNSCEKNYNS